MACTCQRKKALELGANLNSPPLQKQAPPAPLHSSGHPVQSQDTNKGVHYGWGFACWAVSRIIHYRSGARSHTWHLWARGRRSLTRGPATSGGWCDTTVLAARVAVTSVTEPASLARDRPVTGEMEDERGARTSTSSSSPSGCPLSCPRPTRAIESSPDPRRGPW
jgi:hypothetical protein